MNLSLLRDCREKRSIIRMHTHTHSHINIINGRREKWVI